jgi:four helix bundle protein
LLLDGIMGAKTPEELAAYQLARQFKLEIYALMRDSASASTDYRFKHQITDAASGVEANVGEGFYRFRPAEFAQFLRYALASLAETELRLRDGIDRGYYAEASTAVAFRYAKRCRCAMRALHQSLRRAPPDGPGERADRTE